MIIRSTSGPRISWTAARWAERAGLGRLAEILDRLDAESLVDLADGPRPQAGDLQQLDEAGRDLRLEAFVERHPTGRDELGDLVGDGLPDAGDLRRIALAVGLRDVERAAADGVR